ncbi:MAG: hypothetical protein ABH881_01330 [bacterium]
MKGIMEAITSVFKRGDADSVEIARQRQERINRRLNYNRAEENGKAFREFENFLELQTQYREFEDGRKEETRREEAEYRARKAQEATSPSSIRAKNARALRVDELQELDSSLLVDEDISAEELEAAVDSAGDEPVVEVIFESEEGVKNKFQRPAIFPSPPPPIGRSGKISPPKNDCAITKLSKAVAVKGEAKPAEEKQKISYVREIVPRKVASSQPVASSVPEVFERRLKNGTAIQTSLDKGREVETIASWRKRNKVSWDSESGYWPRDFATLFKLSVSIRGKLRTTDGTEVLSPFYNAALSCPVCNNGQAKVNIFGKNLFRRHLRECPGMPEIFVNAEEVVEHFICFPEGRLERRGKNAEVRRVNRNAAA